jgi:hypothetical protein
MHYNEPLGNVPTNFVVVIFKETTQCLAFDLMMITKEGFRLFVWNLVKDGPFTCLHLLYEKLF